ncbi:MAG: hypothetical protein KatS3mg124_2248 [Porticoccaceae bacterium]|nr:MAG: hypothetical protein KatS3mg124_2248 [Porticoccaceae bacterium]
MARSSAREAEAPRLLLHLDDRPAVLGRQGGGVAGEGLQVAQEYRQGGAQFVGDVGHQVAAQGFQPPQAADVADGEHQLAATEGGGAEQKDPLRVPGRAQLQGAVEGARLDEAHEGGIAHQVGDHLAAILLGEAEHLGGGGIPPVQGPVGAEEDQAVFQSGGDLADAQGEGGKVALGLIQAAAGAVELVHELPHRPREFRGQGLFAAGEPGVHLAGPPQAVGAPQGERPREPPQGVPRRQGAEPGGGEEERQAAQVAAESLGQERVAQYGGAIVAGARLPVDPRLSLCRPRRSGPKSGSRRRAPSGSGGRGGPRRAPCAGGGCGRPPSARPCRRCPPRRGR